MKYIITGILLFLFSNTYSQSGSEIFLMEMKVKKGHVILKTPRNITNHKGYDNQPFFHTQKSLLYYSSFNDEGRAEIKSYNYKTHQTGLLTVTIEREYSPTLTPDGNYVSCIIQRDNGAQDLGKYPVGGGQAITIVDDLIVGYHAWADENHLALFVLGDPATLHYLRLSDKKDTILANNIGRSLHRVPGERAVSFVHKMSDAEWLIKKYDPVSNTIKIIAPTLPGREDIAWTPNGFLLSSDGTDIFQWKAGTWEKVVRPKMSDELKGITRLAVDAKGSLLAVVVTE
jgi:hypothetical protein